ncbi:MAG: glycosyltransferase family 2 protein [Spirochaetes bacterium]|nr:glycosyltransferase family 2 protein [Spirochaetota bacterium]
MANKKEYIIIIPIYNEEQHILTVCQKMKKIIDKKVMDILVINDGSTDKTLTILKGIKNINILSHKVNLGYGQSLINGFHYAIKRNYRYIITMDCDWQHDPDQIMHFAQAIRGHWDIISGSRYLTLSPAKKKDVPQDRFTINKKITRKINKITGFHLTDSFCGFKAYKVNILKKLELTEPGYGMPIQLWLEAGKHNLKVREIPVDLIYLDYSRNFHNRFTHAKERYKYYLRILKGGKE